MSDRLSNVVRRKFIDYFTHNHGHVYVPSSSVIPKNDRSVNYVNAGMNQFKSLFLADQESYSPSRVCNYQKCIRVGGKMCDLETIGRDFTHHTFFEMLGNWSFNDYGKEHACEWALDFLVNHLMLDCNKLKVTYCVDKHGEDTETRDIWLNKLGLHPSRVIANREGDNFWEMGSSGPCGMSTEIFYPVGDGLVEIWNIVFIDRQRLSEDKDKIIPLKNKFIDTGMGLERIVSVLEGKNSNYDTDIFRSIFEVIQLKSPSVKPYGGSLTNELDINYRILADHCRMITIALVDGVEPGRVREKFLLRSLIKKVIYISRYVFEQENPRYLIFDIIDEVINILDDAYPELKVNTKMIRRVIAKESKRYLEYLDGQEEKVNKFLEKDSYKLHDTD